jgi:iron complex transport system ATP-binding protein
VSDATALDPVVACKALDLIVGERRVLRGIDWHVRPGERWVVLGPNGAGKSSLLRVAATYQMPSSGRAHVLGEQLGRVNVWTLRPRIGWASPGTARLLKPYLTVRQAIVTGQRAVMTMFRQQFDDREWQRAEMLGRRAGLDELLDRRVDQLSEGERQRLLLARMLMPDPDLLLLDEPTAGLDLPGRERLLAQLTALGEQARPQAIVMVTHHFEEIPPGFTHALLLRDGAVVAAGELPSVLTAQNLQVCFGVGLTLEHRDGRWWAWHARGDLEDPSQA